LYSTENVFTAVSSASDRSITLAGQSPNFVLPSIAKQFAEIEAGLRPPKLAVGGIDVKRDFTDVRDVIQAYIALLDKGTAGEVYNGLFWQGCSSRRHCREISGNVRENR